MRIVTIATLALALTVPAGASAQAPSLSSFSGVSTTAPAKTTTTTWYRVRAGDTLSGIARRYGTSWQRLATLNGMRNPNALRVGQRIKVRGTAPRTTVRTTTTRRATTTRKTTTTRSASSACVRTVRAAMPSVPGTTVRVECGPVAGQAVGLTRYSIDSRGRRQATVTVDGAALGSQDRIRRIALHEGGHVLAATYCNAACRRYLDTLPGVDGYYTGYWRSGGEVVAEARAYCLSGSGNHPSYTRISCSQWRHAIELGGGRAR